MSPPVRYARGAIAVAAASGVVAVAGVAATAGATGWAIAAWAALSVLGVGGGAWVAREHGRPGSGFVVAIGSAMILRSVAALSLLVLALRSGDGALAPCLAGLAAGFVPQLLFEVVWFHRIGAAAGRRG